MENLRLPVLNLSQGQIEELQEFFKGFAKCTDPYLLHELITKSTKHFWREDFDLRAVPILLNDHDFPTLYTEVIPWVSSLFSRVSEIFPTPLRGLTRLQPAVETYSLEQLVVVLSLIFFGLSRVPHFWFEVLAT
jgi:hypothetical protein